MSSIRHHALVALTLLTLGGCTGAAQGIRFASTSENFGAVVDVNLKIDLLWVVDNSASMDVSQRKLRDGMTTFANKYMQPSWDIRVAVIPTDAFIANTAFQPYVNQIVPGSVNYYSPHIYSQRNTWQNPAATPNLVNLTNGRFTNGFRMKDVFPYWGPDYAKLLPGTHDGPTTAMCFEVLPYFFRGIADCRIRDVASANQGTANCINPGGGETSETQCVNTVQNDTIHTGKPFLETTPPVGVQGNAAWVDQLIDDFMVNITTGSIGAGSERGLASVLQFVADNESSQATRFFRPDALRGVIFVSDEEDQSLVLPANPPAGFGPYSEYACDQAGLLALNPGNPASITGSYGYCCTTPGNNCTYGSSGTSCASKTVDGFTYTPSLCTAGNLMTIGSVKSQLDSFFTGLDLNAGGDPNYFVASIVPLTAQSIQTLQAARAAEDSSVGTIVNWSVDRGDRYIALGNAVGAGSVALDIGASDYTPVLDAIGQAIINKKSTFKLSRIPDAGEKVALTLRHSNGATTLIPESKYVVQGLNVMITDYDLVLSFQSGDTIGISYFPISI